MQTSQVRRKDASPHDRYYFDDLYDTPPVHDFTPGISPRVGVGVPSEHLFLDPSPCCPLVFDPLTFTAFLGGVAMAMALPAPIALKYHR